ncbi:uncharacterized protein LOC142978037 [Anticarsia gemmatalis]|uniref:uncharacterized protein LOC142978037 n=1 Tax=Anticarsia gemmatalis TaxID=129554 RepID=UPI003F76613C
MQWSPVLLFGLSIFGLVLSYPSDITFFTGKEILEGDAAMKNALIEQQLKGLLEEFRETMLTGSSTLPVLDPLYIHHVEVDETIISVPDLRVVIGDAKLHKLSTFVVEELTVRRPILSLNYRVQLDVHIPVLHLDAGYYDLAASMDGINIFGAGDARIFLFEPRISGHVLARPVLGLGTLHVRLQECEIKLGLRGFESHINGLLGGDATLDAFVNTFLGFFVPDLVKMYEVEISEMISALVLQYGNEILADLNLIDIIG